VGGGAADCGVQIKLINTSHKQNILLTFLLTASSFSDAVGDGAADCGVQIKLINTSHKQNILLTTSFSTMLTSSTLSLSDVWVDGVGCVVVELN
jgi:hypothetical protein